MLYIEHCANSRAVTVFIRGGMLMFCYFYFYPSQTYIGNLMCSIHRNLGMKPSVS